MSLLLLFGGASPVTPSTPVFSAIPPIAVELELSGVGAGWTDVTRDVIRSTPVEISYGMRDRALVAGTGTLRFQMNNSTTNSARTLGYYSLFNANKRIGWRLNIGIRVRLTDPSTLIIHTWFIGKVALIVPAPGIHGSRVVDVVAVDWMDSAARWNLTADIPPQVGSRGDQCVAAVVAAMPNQPQATSYDTTPDIYAYALDVGRIGKSPALSEFARIANSGQDRIYLKRDGTLRVESRHTRLLNTTPAWTLTDGELIAIDGIAAPAFRDDIVNTVRTVYHPKRVDATADSTVYAQAHPIYIAAGDTQMLMGSYRDQDTGDSIGAVDTQDPAPGVDYFANDVENFSGTDRTANVSIAAALGSSGVRLDVTNGFGGGVWFQLQRVRGKRVLQWDEQQREATDATSISDNDEHAVTVDMTYQGNGEVAQGAAEFILARDKDIQAQVREFGVVARSASELTQILTREISDLVSLSETLTGIDDNFFIDAITLTIGPVVTQARYAVSRSTVPYDTDYFILDSSSLDSADVLVPF